MICLFEIKASFFPRDLIGQKTPLYRVGRAVLNTLMLLNAEALITLKIQTITASNSECWSLVPHYL